MKRFFVTVLLLCLMSPLIADPGCDNGKKKSCPPEPRCFIYMGYEFCIIVKPSP